MAILLNAANERFSRTTSVPTADAHTFCCWARRQGDQNNYSTFVQLMNSGGTIGNFLGFLDTGDDIGISNYSANVTVLSAPGTGNWVFAAMTCSGSGAGLFIGYAGLATATSLSSATHTRGTFTPARIDIGGDQFGENQLNGDIAYLKIWGAALTAQELEQERWSAWPVRWANLNSFYPFFSPANDTIDHSGAALTLTRTSAGTQADNPPVSLWPVLWTPEWQGNSTAASGTTETFQDGDTVSFTENLASAVTRVKSLADTLGLTEGIAVVRSRLKSITDTLSLTENLAAVRSRLKSVSDTIGLTENLVVARTKVKSVADTIGLTENLTALIIKVSSVSDTLGLTENLETAITRASSVSDTVSFTEGLAKVRTRVLSISDSLGLTENLSKVRARVKTVSDTVSLTESLTVTKVVLDSADDTLGLTESLQGTVIPGSSSSPAHDSYQVLLCSGPSMVLPRT